MKAWGFVFLAYGIVSVSLVLYFFLLKRRLSKAQVELERLRSLEGVEQDAKK